MSEEAVVRARGRILLVALTATVVGGCGLLLDLAPPDDAGQAPPRDGGPPPGDAQVTECAGNPDGAPCGTSGICLAERCQDSLCGDGFHDERAGEECDEATSTCVDCRVVCDCGDLAARACIARVDCMAAECVPVLEPDGTECLTDADRRGTCGGALCVPEGCGDAFLETDEECDDGNRIAGDGCEPDCLFSCHTDADCDDGDLCNGLERCVTEEGPQVCGAGAPPTVASCEICTPDIGPHLPDADRDGFPADVGQPCEAARQFDCDDDDPATFPGAVEVCNAADDDCDALIDENLSGSEPATVACAIDADGDGYPGSATPASTVSGCMPCPSGSVPIRLDSESRPLIDCWDVADAFGPRVHPSQTMLFVDPYCDLADPRCALPFDYDCNGIEQRGDERTGPDCSLLSLGGCRGSGWLPPVPACGQVGRFAMCQPVALLFCGAQMQDRQQRCR